MHGVGKKTAERIIVELRDKVDPLEALAGRTAGGGRCPQRHARDAILALSQLGFPQDQARKMVQSALMPTRRDRHRSLVAQSLETASEPPVRSGRRAAFGLHAERRCAGQVGLPRNAHQDRDVIVRIHAA